MSMNAQATDRMMHVTDPVERSMLVATCLWGGQCYGPCPHHSASHQEVKEALDWLEQHPAEVRSWEERRAAGRAPLGLLIAGHAGELEGAFWECQTCGFRFDAVHTDPAGGYSCPACEATLLRELLSTLADAVRGSDHPTATAALVNERLRMWDEAAGVLAPPLDRTAAAT
jgi:hypothetical protein